MKRKNRGGRFFSLPVMWSLNSHTETKEKFVTARFPLTARKNREEETRRRRGCTDWVLSVPLFVFSLEVIYVLGKKRVEGNSY